MNLRSVQEWPILEQLYTFWVIRDLAERTIYVQCTDYRKPSFRSLFYLTKEEKGEITTCAAFCF